MRRALDLADGMRGYVWPNPPVGCVIVKNGVVLAEAATHPGGRPHAERKALKQAEAEAAGATLYVTLEPCCHWGRTPPCADAIIEAGVSRVVCAIQDPDPRVNGGGFAKLRQAGVDLTIGPGADEAERMMSGFFHRVRTGEPELIILVDAPSTAPAGVDALIKSYRQSLRLLTRREGSGTGIDITRILGHRLLRHLASIGLTSVAISRGDPITRCLLMTRPRQS